MSFETISWALAQPCLKPHLKMVLVTLANFRNQTTGQCNPSQKTLARACSQSVSTINTHLVDFHPELTRGFHRELTHLEIMLVGS